MWTIKTLINEFNKIGIVSGTKIIVHSSYKSFGDVENGPQTIVDALIQSVGPDGLILMPTFSFSFERLSGESEIFDKETTPSRVGIITEFFRKTAGVIRSEHPTHSVAIYGKRKEEFLQQSKKSTALGKNSIFHLLSKTDATLYHFGCGFNSSSIIHTGEVLAHVFYKDLFSFREVRNSTLIKNGPIVKRMELKETPGCSKSFEKLEPVALKENLLQIQSSPLSVKYIKAKDLLKLVIRELKTNPLFLLCPKGHCEVCDDRYTYYEKNNFEYAQNISNITMTEETI